MSSFNVSECKQSGPYEILSTIRLTAAGKRITRCLFDEWKRVREMCPLAARYTRQETLPALLLRYCPIFSLVCSAFLFPLKPRILELHRPSRYMEVSYMEARVYRQRWILKDSFCFQYTQVWLSYSRLSCIFD